MANRRELAEILMNDTCEGELIWYYISFEDLPPNLAHITLEQWYRFICANESRISDNISEMVCDMLSQAESEGELEDDED